MPRLLGPTADPPTPHGAARGPRWRPNVRFIMTISPLALRLRSLWAGLACASALACSEVRPAEAGGPGTTPQPFEAADTNPDHPFLLVREEDYPALRTRVALAPWRNMALSAIDYASNQVFDPSASDFDAKTRMTDLCGALALAYVLDPRPLRVRKLRDTLQLWQGYYQATAQPGNGVVVRWQQSAMVQSILALDVMHDALDPLDRAALEGMFDDMILGWWNNRAQDGTPSTPGVVAIWALYRGYRSLTNEATGIFLERVFDALTPSGTYSSGCGYAWVREGSDRMSKYALLDVLEFTGTRTGLYSDPRLVGLHEWMYRGAYTPRRTNLTFGDSDPSRPIEGLLGYLQPYRANRFSAAAGRNAAWVVRDVTARPLLSSYTLLDLTALTPEAPTSALWGDGASFWEAGASEQSLMGALWNSRVRSGHSHRDVNAVHLYAYGENVLRNSGYCGFGVGIDALFDWDWVFEATASNNTVTIAGAEHDEKIGAGILESLCAPRFDYAAGGSGPALESGTHTRSLLMVHGEPGLPGYFVLLDEVEADVPGSSVNVNLHPDSQNVATLAPGLEYEWTIRHFGTVDVFVNLFLATRPASVELLDGGLCAFDGNEYVGKYLRSHYPTDAQGRRNAVTLVVPHDASHPKPALARLAGGGLFSGAGVTLSPSVSDFVVESSGLGPVPFGPGFLHGKGLHCRVASGTVSQYFLRAGRGFGDGRAQPRGFDSDAEISLFARGTAVWVISAGARVVFHEPALVGNVFTSSAGTVTAAGPGFVELLLTPGTHAFDLHTGAALP